MRKFLKKLVCGVCALCTAAGAGIPAAAVQTEAVYLYEDFNSYAANESATKLEAENTVPYVADIAQNDKGIRVKTGIAKGKLKNIWGESADDLIIAFDIKETVERSPVDISVLDKNGAEATLLSVTASGEVKTYDGKKIGGIPFDKLASIAVHIDWREAEFDAYINGKCVLSDWYMPSTGMRAAGVQFTLGAGETLAAEVYLDNVRAYSGTNVNKKFSPSAYNEEVIDIIDVSDRMGAAVITQNDFNSLPENPEPGETTILVNNLSCLTKGNVLRRKTEGDNSYAYWEQNTANDTHIDVSYTNDVNYLVTQGDFRFVKFGSTIHLFIVRDNVSNVTNADMTAVTIDSSGAAVAGGKVSLGKLKLNKWYNIAVAWDIPNRVFTVYIDGEPAAEKVPFTSANFYKPRMSRLWIFGNFPTAMELDNYWIYEAKEPVSDLSEIEGKWVSVMSDGTREREMLSGKTAVSTANGVSFAGDKQIKLNKPEYRDGDYYMSRDDAQTLFGSLPEGFRDLEEIPIKSAAAELGLKTYEDADRYLLIFSEQSFKAEDSLMDEVATFMKMIVPSAGEMKADFEQMNVPHPRLLATSDTWESIKQQIAADPEFAAWHKKIIASADSLLNKEVDTYRWEVQENILHVARYFKEKMEKWGYAWKTTGDRKYIDAAWPEIKSICEFPDWDPVHILDTGELLYGAAIGYDWMYDAWTEEQKKTIEEATLKLGIEVVRSAYYGKLHTSQKFGHLSGGTFVSGTTNFNVVANGGMTAACMAFGDIYPEECFDGASKAIQSLMNMLPKFEPDGAWEEGPNYWNYTTDYLAKMVASLETACGTDYTILSHPGVGQTPYYAMYLDSYQGVNNFSDTAIGMKWDSPQLSCFGKYLGEKAFSYLRYAEITERGMQPTLYDMIWYDPAAKADKPTLPLDNTTRGIDLVSIREDWDRSDSLYLGAHGGQNNVYHAHYDGGTFVFDLLGERWAMDLGMDMATYVGHFMYDVYRGRAEGHNMLVFNPDMGEDFIMQSTTPLVRFESKPKGAIAVYDNTGGYSKWCSYVKRGFYVGDERRSMTVRDEFKTLKSNKPTEVYWNMQTPAEIEIDGHTAILTINGQQLKVEFASNAADFEVLAMKTEPLPGTPNPDFMARDNYNKLVVKCTSDGEPCYIEAKMSAAGEKASETGMLNMPIDDWTLPDGELVKRGASTLSGISADGKPLSNFRPNQTKYTIGVLEGATIPQITASSDNGRVEVRQAESVDEKTIITSYDTAGNFKTVYYVEYTELKIPQDVFGMTRNIVYDLQVSSTPEEANFGANMLDGDLGTRWASEGVGEYAIFDLGSVKPIDAVAFAYEWGDVRNYSLEVEVSEDGDYYVPVWSGISCGYTTDMELAELPQRYNARYVKLIGNGNTVNNWNGVREFAILTRK